MKIQGQGHGQNLSKSGNFQVWPINPAKNDI